MAIVTTIEGVPVQNFLRLAPKGLVFTESEERKYRRKRFNEISTCTHELITIKGENVNACIKCGLSETVWNKRDTNDEEIQYDYLRKYERFIIGHHTGITCELGRALDVYEVIKDENKGAPEDKVILEFVKAMEKLQKEEKKLDFKP